MKNVLNKKVYVGMSGGVDSSVTAMLLKREGYDVSGCFIKGWYPEDFLCSWQEDRRDAMRVAGKIGIPFYTLDLEKEYKKEVVDYMLRSFRKGETPNPDIMCNKHVKFGAFLNWAIKQGADYVATGHYIKKGESRSHTIYHTLHTALDTNKDQSYFLWTLTQAQLKHCLFPLGNLRKSEVREIARQNGLSTAEKKDSQGVCFIGEFEMIDFLKKYIKPKKGKIMDLEGNVVGEHDGAIFYTIGQRHGISYGGRVPYYIVGKNVKKNILIVSDKADEKKSYRKEILIRDVNWISEPPRPNKIYKARVRYRQPLQTCRVTKHVSGIKYYGTEKNKIKNTCYIIHFLKAQRAVTAGQSLVVYSGKTMLGGGVIA